MKEILQQFKQNYLIKYWNPVAAVIAAGLISAYYFGVTGTYWAVTGEFTRWGGHALQALGVDVSDWSYYKIIGMQGTIFTRIDGVMILGMFAGCISAALWAKCFKLCRGGRTGTNCGHCWRYSSLRSHQSAVKSRFKFMGTLIVNRWINHACTRNEITRLIVGQTTSLSFSQITHK